MAKAGGGCKIGGQLAGRPLGFGGGNEAAACIQLHDAPMDQTLEMLGRAVWIFKTLKKMLNHIGVSPHNCLPPNGHLILVQRPFIKK